MIQHLQEREKALEPLGWTGRQADWIALACLHGGGMFTRAQLCAGLQADRWHALRFVRALIARGLASEDVVDGLKVCRITSRRIYRALGVEDVRHRRTASKEVFLRRLLSLDYVLEHTNWSWLPTEAEQVRAFEALGIEGRRLPQRVHWGAAGGARRHFPLKLPIALGPDRAVFVFVDPGYGTVTALRSWAAAHRSVWDTLRKLGRSVEVVNVAADPRALDRAERVLRRWADGSGVRDSTDRDEVEEEIARIEQAILDGDVPTLDTYGGLQAALKCCVALKKLPRQSRGRSVIDGFAVWQSTRTPGRGFSPV